MQWLCVTNRNLYDMHYVINRYKTHEETRAERRNFFTEKEIPIQAPIAPPRTKKQRQSFREFREESQKQQKLFQSEHTTEEGVDLLPVKKTIAFGNDHTVTSSR